jgi:dihydrodipicolinate synthase/N-acetylneuraminate lyase
MWSGVFPAVTTKFTADDELDHKEMERCFALQMEAGCDGIIVAGSLGEGPMLSHDEKLEVLKIAQDAAAGKPVLMTVNEAGTREAEQLGRLAAKAGASGLMVVPSPIYHTNPDETVAAMSAVAAAADLPVMIYSNRVAYRVDVTLEIMERLGADAHFVAIKESSDDIRRTTEIINAFGDRFDLFTGVDNLAFEALSVGAIGWVAGLVTAFPRETVAIYQLMKQGRRDEALSIYRWFRPLLDLDVSTYLVQNQ